MTFEEWVPSILAAIGLGGAGIYGYGRLQGRVTAQEARQDKMEARQEKMEDAVDKLGQIREAVATIEERTKNTAESTREQAGDLRRLTDHIMNEDRSFARRIIRDEGGRG